jgi:hypothetical protein
MSLQTRLQASYQRPRSSRGSHGELPVARSLSRKESRGEGFAPAASGAVSTAMCGVPVAAFGLHDRTLTPAPLPLGRGERFFASRWRKLVGVRAGLVAPKNGERGTRSVRPAADAGVGKVGWDRDPATGRRDPRPAPRAWVPGLALRSLGLREAHRTLSASRRGPGRSGEEAASQRPSPPRPPGRTRPSPGRDGAPFYAPVTGRRKPEHPPSRKGTGQHRINQARILPPQHRSRKDRTSRPTPHDRCRPTHDARERAPGGRDARHISLSTAPRQEIFRAPPRGSRATISPPRVATSRSDHVDHHADVVRDDAHHVADRSGGRCSA